MKSIRLIFVITLLFSSLNIFAQGVDIVTLTTSAEGKTKDEAVTTALRNAIEQAFGTFISSKTEIVNDDLIKDEIVSVASGNIQKYDVISTTTLPNGNTVVSVKADVSVSKLTTFSESKGIEVEFKGALFAANIKLQQLYTKNELIAIKHFKSSFLELLSVTQCYDYSIEVSDPIRGEDVYRANKENTWILNHTVKITPNNNLKKLLDYFTDFLNGISMEKEEVNNYKAEGKKCFKYSISYTYNDPKYKYYYFRNKETIEEIADMIGAMGNSQYSFIVKNGLTNVIFMGHKRQKDLHIESGYPIDNVSVDITIKPNIYFPENISVRGKKINGKLTNTIGIYRGRIPSESYSQNEGRYSKLEGWKLYFNAPYAGRIGSDESVNILYFIILTLNDLEKIQKYTVEPYEDK